MHRNGKSENDGVYSRCGKVMEDTNITTLLGVADGDQTKERRKKIRKRVFAIIFVLLNVSIIAATAYIDFTKRGKPTAPLGINMRFIIAAVGCYVVSISAESCKYFIMIREFTGISSFRMAFEVALLGKYYDNITPTGAGGQPFQVYYLKKKSIPTGTSAALPITGFLTLQISFILLAIVVFAFGTPYLHNVEDYTTAFKISAYVGILFYSFVPLMIITFAIYPKPVEAVVRFFVMALSRIRIIKDRESMRKRALATLGEYRDGIVAIYKKKHMFLKLIGFGLAYQISICSIPFFVLRAFGSDLSYFTVFSMTVLIYFAVTYIPTPGNSGVMEASFYALFATLNQSYLFWAMIIWRFFSYYSFLMIGGGIFAFGAIETKLKAKRP